ncbi:L-ascorbate metabolism protein UlaG (beta-lactamase superfamily) [Hymenobacter luteus]|uniref:L-ascorbate metabolism protein UlaG (Beta-lactamase superfamily) n=2 Tax=Hymenobacter TaxID=89966 RepID=A0A7W9SZY9_9BACT|nr:MULTISPECIES: MBL fold metallo-hydrolase [Hymenobacter]MBB4600771.1 L-ascorbate metabolism protein UlaG (beta-lactamase superfamily) [Hymenobacter latericoloratus]MBB6059022.1 L-ascorbate metabolism protein UlaG (beta-lactamase superfamily) [Hymenobacter luteus]
MAPTPRFVRNPQLATIKPNYPGNKMIGAEYCNGEELYEPNFGTVIKWQLSENPQKEEKKADTWVPEVVDCTPFLQNQEDGLVWLGHASFLLRISGKTILFDPVLFSSLGLRHRHPLPCRPEDLTNLDYLLLSHGHRDHLDEKSIKLLARQNPQLRAFGPLGMAKLVRGMARTLPVQEAGWWQQFDLGPDAPFELFYLPASHWHRRGLFDLNTVLWGSFLLRLPDGRTLYFMGDTSMADHFEAIEKQFGPLDVVLLPIGAYKPPYMMQMSHVNPHEAAKAANLLRAGHLVPMHYGTFDLSDEPASEPIRELQLVANGKMLRGELHVPAVGEVLRWQDWE